MPNIEEFRLLSPEFEDVRVPNIEEFRLLSPEFAHLCAQISAGPLHGMILILRKTVSTINPAVPTILMRGVHEEHMRL